MYCGCLAPSLSAPHAHPRYLLHMHVPYSSLIAPLPGFPVLSVRCNDHKHVHTYYNVVGMTTLLATSGQPDAPQLRTVLTVHVQKYVVHQCNDMI